jgi:hypothetical protein
MCGARLEPVIGHEWQCIIIIQHGEARSLHSQRPSPFNRTIPCFVKSTVYRVANPELHHRVLLGIVLLLEDNSIAKVSPMMMCRSSCRK